VFFIPLSASSHHHIKLLMLLLTIFAERLRNKHVLARISLLSTKCMSSSESRHQCVAKEQFLSSSKVCSKKLWVKSQWIIFLIQQYTLGI